MSDVYDSGWLTVDDFVEVPDMPHVILCVDHVLEDGAWLATDARTGTLYYMTARPRVRVLF